MDTADDALHAPTPAALSGNTTTASGLDQSPRDDDRLSSTESDRLDRFCRRCHALRIKRADGAEPCAICNGTRPVLANAASPTSEPGHPLPDVAPVASEQRQLEPADTAHHESTSSPGAFQSDGFDAYQQIKNELQRDPELVNATLNLCFKVKNRFKHRSRVYDRFLDLMDLSQGSQEPRDHVHAEIMDLFRDEPDLWAEYSKRFVLALEAPILLSQHMHPQQAKDFADHTATFMNEVKRKSSGRPELYDKLLGVIRNFARDGHMPGQVISDITYLLNNDQDLALAFDRYLSKGFDSPVVSHVNTMSAAETANERALDGSEVSVSRQQIDSDASEDMQPSGITPDSPAHAHYHDETVKPATSPANTPAQDAEHAPPVNLNQALAFVDRVQHHFTEQPDKYEQFLEVLQAYQRDSTPIHHVHAELVVLLNEASDLLEGLQEFLPHSMRSTDESQENSDVSSLSDTVVSKTGDIKSAETPASAANSSYYTQHPQASYRRANSSSNEDRYLSGAGEEKSQDHYIRSAVHAPAEVVIPDGHGWDPHVGVAPSRRRHVSPASSAHEPYGAAHRDPTNRTSDDEAPKDASESIDTDNGSLSRPLQTENDHSTIPARVVGSQVLEADAGNEMREYILARLAAQPSHVQTWQPTISHSERVDWILRIFSSWRNAKSLESQTEARRILDESIDRELFALAGSSGSEDCQNRINDLCSQAKAGSLRWYILQRLESQNESFKPEDKGLAIDIEQRVDAVLRLFTSSCVSDPATTPDAAARSLQSELNAEQQAYSASVNMVQYLAIISDHEQSHVMDRAAKAFLSDHGPKGTPLHYVSVHSLSNEPKPTESPKFSIGLSEVTDEIGKENANAAGLSSTYDELASEDFASEDGSRRVPSDKHEGHPEIVNLETYKTKLRKAWLDGDDDDKARLVTASLERGDDSELSLAPSLEHYDAHYERTSRYTSETGSSFARDEISFSHDTQQDSLTAPTSHSAEPIAPDAPKKQPDRSSHPAHRSPDDDIMSLLSNPDMLSPDDAQAGRHWRRIAAEKLIGNELANHQTLYHLHSHALSRLDTRRFAANFQRLLGFFCLELGNEARSAAERMAVDLLKSKVSRLSIAEKVTECILEGASEDFEQRERNDRELSMMERFLMALRDADVPEEADVGDDQGPEASLDEECSEDIDLTPHIAKVRKFLCEGPAFQNLVANMREFLLPSKYSTLTRTLTSLPAENIHFSITDTGFSPFNNIQLRLERAADARWIWWPLPAPRQPLAPGETCISWTCHCGSHEYRNVATSYADAVQKLLSVRRIKPSAVHMCKHHMTSHNDTAKESTSSTGGSSRSSTWSSSSTVVNQETSTAPDLKQATHPAQQPSTCAQTTAKNSIAIASDKLYVLFGVRGSRTTLEMCHVDITDQSDDAYLYRSLKERHNQVRGLLSRLLSVWQLHYCDFVRASPLLLPTDRPTSSMLTAPQFRKITTDQVVRHGRQPEQELPTDSSYVYHPRAPGAEPPPIYPHEFEASFAWCAPGCRLARVHRCAAPAEGRGALDLIPKKRDVFEVGARGRGDAWGLLAVRSVSLVGVLAYLGVILAGPFAFWAWWEKTHGGDLQNAAVPFSAVVGLLAVFGARSGLAQGMWRE